MLQLIDVTKVYQMGKNRVEALKNANLEVKSGEFVALVGESGSGKSTLMNIAGLLDVPSSGKVCLNGQPVEQMTEDQQAQRRRETIGFIFQSFYLQPYLTAVENVMLPMFFEEGSKKRKERALELLELVGMTERAEHLPSELSGGQKQRVAIARALANHPSLILADEPTGNLDSETGFLVMDLLKNLTKRNMGILMVTHNTEHLPMTDRAYRIRDGRVEAVT